MEGCLAERMVLSLSGLFHLIRLERSTPTSVGVLLSERLLLSPNLSLHLIVKLLLMLCSLSLLPRDLMLWDQSLLPILPKR